MTRSSLLNSLPANTVRSDISVTADTLWIVPVGRNTSDVAIVRVYDDVPFDIVGYAKSLAYKGHTDTIKASMRKIGQRTHITEVKTNLCFVLPESAAHMDIDVQR